MRQVAAVVLVVIATGCSVFVRVDQRVDLAPVTTLEPRSAGGASLNVPYPFDMPHCGIHSPIDLDGSFWDPVNVDPASLEFDNASGTLRLIAVNRALFTSASEAELQLVRHLGAKTFPLCE